MQRYDVQLKPSYDQSDGGEDRTAESYRYQVVILQLHGEQRRLCHWNQEHQHQKM